MTVSKSLKPVSIAILVMIALQVISALAFLGFFVIDVGGLTSRPTSYDTREIIQIVAALGLTLSVIINAFFLRKILRRASAMEFGLMAARGAFHDLIEMEFDKWALSPAEREVALFAIKGCSNLEIAQMTGKSEGTVKSQTNAVFRKAGFSGRVQLVSHFVDELIGAEPGTAVGAAPAPRAAPDPAPARQRPELPAASFVPPDRSLPE